MHWVDDFVKEMSIYFDSPRIFLRTLGYWCASVSLSDRIWIHTGDKLYPNTYMLIVAPPGWYRKSSVAGKTVKILNKVIGKGKRLPDHPSTESFAIQDLKRKGVGYLYYDEFEDFIKHSGKEYASGLQSMIIQLFGQNLDYEISRINKANVKATSDCILSFLSTSTTESLMSIMKKHDVASGFMSRFLVLEGSKKEQELPRQPKMDDTVLDRLASNLSFIVNASQGEFQYTQEGEKEYTDCYFLVKKYMDDQKESHPEIPDLLNRACVYLDKLSMVEASLCGDTIITKDHVITVWNNVISPYIRSIMSLLEEGMFQTYFHKMETRIIKHLSNNGGSLTRRDIIRKMHLPLHEINSILSTLEAQGRLELRMEGKSMCIYISNT